MATSIYDKLPKYHQLEVNSLKGILPGFVIAQIPFKANDDLLQAKYNVLNSTSTTVGTMVANGHIVMLGADGLQKAKANAATGTVASSTATIANVPADQPLFITYNDPIVRFGPKRSYSFYATDLDEEHVRAVQLIPGDEWMSDIDYFEQSSGSYVYPGAANFVGRIVKVDATNASAIKNSDDFYNKTELADGTAAFHYIFIK